MEQQLNGPEVVSPGEIGHFVYCPRSWAIISAERLWSDNVHTAAGQVAHTRIDGAESRGQFLYHVTVWSDKEGLYGVADSVEMSPTGPVPVEYKSAKQARPDHIAQLAAQALCLEEMYGTPVPRGAIWLSKVRRKVPVLISPRDKQTARDAAGALRGARLSSAMPAPVADQRCTECSLHWHCLPKVVAERRRASNLHASLFVPPKLNLG